MVGPDRDILLGALSEFENSDKAAYPLSMWRTAIQAYEAAHDASVTPPFENFSEPPYPYLPVPLHTYGVDLTEGATVVDIGCLAGYGLFDLAWRRQSEGLTIPRMIGVDISPVSIAMGSRLADLWACGHDVSFVEASAESLPLPDASVDLVVARLVLPYVRIDRTLDEIVRVLRHGGAALLQIHGFQYYINQLRNHARQPKRCAYYVRPLLSGMIFSLLRRQPASRWLSETAMPLAALDRLMATRACTDVWSSGFRVRPMALFQKE